MIVIKKMFVWSVSIWYIALTVINRIWGGYTWRLLLYDLFSGFRDNRIYFSDVFLPVTVLVLIMSVVLVLLVERKLVLRWEIRIHHSFFSLGELKFIRKYEKTLMLLISVSAAGLLLVLSGKQIVRGIGAKWQGDLTVAHAGGEIDGYNYSNCLEAILVNYEKGQRTFEIDFSVTSDNKLVCKHDWEYVVQEGGVPGEAWEEQRFLSVPIFGQYTPLSFGTLCQLMEEYPDIWVVTDTKDAETKDVQRDFEIMVDTAKGLGLESVLDRIIVQVYNEEMYDTVSHIYPFKSWIYTLYQFFGGDAETFRECVRFCYGHNIDGITTWNYFATPELIQIAEEYGISMYAHTEDDIENARDMIAQGLTGVYTNIITPGMLKED